MTMRAHHIHKLNLKKIRGTAQPVGGNRVEPVLPASVSLGVDIWSLSRIHLQCPCRCWVFSTAAQLFSSAVGTIFSYTSLWLCFCFCLVARNLYNNRDPCSWIRWNCAWLAWEEPTSLRVKRWAANPQSSTFWVQTLIRNGHLCLLSWLKNLQGTLFFPTSSFRAIVTVASLAALWGISWLALPLASLGFPVFTSVLWINDSET